MIELEIGLSSFKDMTKEKKLDDKINEFKSQFPNVKLSLYDGIDSIFSSGRKSINGIKETIENIDIINQNNVPFILVMSSGLLFDKLPLQKLSFEKEILDYLEKNAKKEEIKNGVVIGHDDLLHYVRKFNPDLKTICSTIQMIDINKFTSYEDKFQKYDLVVPLNQHTSYNFLKQYEQYADKMLLFLNLPCYDGDLLKCYKHYAKIELNLLGSYGEIPENVKFDFNDFSRREEFELVLNDDDSKKAKQLPQNQCKNINCKNDEGKSNVLYLRDDFIQLYSMGVNKFKIPREFELPIHQLNSIKAILKF